MKGIQEGYPALTVENIAPDAELLGCGEIIPLRKPDTLEEKQALQRIINLIKEWMGAEGEVDYRPGKKGSQIDLL